MMYSSTANNNMLPGKVQVGVTQSDPSSFMKLYQPKEIPMTGALSLDLEELAMIYCLCDQDFSKPLFGDLSHVDQGHMTRIDNISYKPSIMDLNSTPDMNNYAQYNMSSFNPHAHLGMTDRFSEFDRYKCEYKGCEQTLINPSNVLHHSHMHAGVKPYICQWCGKGFTQKGNLKKHVRQHIHPDVNDRKRYTCKLCGKGYTERYNLRAHMKRHHPEN